MISFFGNENYANAKYEKLAYNFSFNDLDGSSLSLADFKGKIIVVINVASQCGFTNQYEDMQKIWEKYQSKGVIMLGIPSNDFGQQEPGTNKEIKNFCEAKFGITFPMTEKVSVKAVPKWNFHKIIINKEGKIEITFSSMTNPSSKKFKEVIENLL